MSNREASLWAYLFSRSESGSTYSSRKGIPVGFYVPDLPNVAIGATLTIGMVVSGGRCEIYQQLQAAAVPYRYWRRMSREGSRGDFADVGQLIGMSCRPLIPLPQVRSASIRSRRGPVQSTRGERGCEPGSACVLPAPPAGRPSRFPREGDCQCCDSPTYSSMWRCATAPEIEQEAIVADCFLIWHNTSRLSIPFGRRAL